MFIKLKYAVYIIITIIFATEFIAYLNGGVSSTEYLSISQPDTDNPVGYFTINNKYWGIGGNFQQYKMITATNQKDTEIRFIQTDSFPKENKCTVYYLPISKFVVNIEIPLKTDNYIFYKFNSQNPQPGAFSELGI